MCFILLNLKQTYRDKIVRSCMIFNHTVNRQCSQNYNISGTIKALDLPIISLKDRHMKMGHDLLHQNVDT